MQTRSKVLPSLLAAAITAVFGAFAGADVASAGQLGPNYGGGGGIRPSLHITPRMNPNFHYDRIRLPEGGKGGGKNPDGRNPGDSGPGASNDGGRRHPPRKKIVIIDSGPIWPIGPSGMGPGGPGGSSGSGAAPRRSNAPIVSERRFLPNEVLITVNANVPDQSIDTLARRHRLSRLESQIFQLTNTRMFRWQIQGGRSVASVIRSLEAEGIVAMASPNHLFSLQQDAKQQSDPTQYTVTKLRLSQAHGLGRGGNVLVSVIDSGIDAAHPELAGVVADSFDPLGNEPAHAHGTAIAGAIASHARLVGAAPAAQILAVRAFGAKSTGGQGTTFNILKSLDWSVQKGARIINMSFAGPRDVNLERAFAAATHRGVILIAAAGNAGAKSPPLYPAADPNVIAVSATDADDKLFSASNRGTHIAVAAPGVDILLPAPDAAYQVTSGTSFSAAYVSGIAALMLERNPSLTPNAVRQILMTSAKDIGPKGRDESFGAGLADAYQAITAAGPQTTTASGQPAQPVR